MPTASEKNLKENKKVRLDKYLWSIRIFKTRTQASEAIDKGKVKFNGALVKASRNVQQGDVYEAKTEHKNWVIKVIQLVEERLAYTEAIKFYEDLTPIEELHRIQQVASSFHTGKRLSKIGRPTKKDRRDLREFLD